MHIPKHGVRGGLGYGVDWGTGWIGVRGGLGNVRGYYSS